MIERELNKRMEERIFKAALKLLARKGFDRNSVRQIAEKTKINENLINACFEGNSQMVNDLFNKVKGSMRA